MLKIVDRTKPRTSISKPTIQIIEPVVVESKISKVEEFTRIAESIRAKKALITKPKVSKVESKKPELPKIKSILEVANEIKLKRLIRKENTVLTPKDEYKEFKCIRKTGEELILTPTKHAISQFKWRYWILNPKLEYEDEDKVLKIMRIVFNQGVRIANSGYMYRNSKRKDSVSAMVWGTKSIAFLIDATTSTIITCELIGKYRKYNKPKFKNMVKSHTFNHSLMVD